MCYLQSKAWDAKEDLALAEFVKEKCHDDRWPGRESFSNFWKEAAKVVNKTAGHMHRTGKICIISLNLYQL